MQNIVKIAILGVFVAHCATTDQNLRVAAENEPCQLREVERFIRHFACPEGAYIQRVQTVAAGQKQDPILQVTCVRLAVACERQPSGPVAVEQATR